ncbi:hypothetical protein TNCV_1467281 [Trichonephila clavipes]|uniref:Uncharacterized protein n=1 Tax=Trichonephila clavipes TaxID=2585209 RepID=A0A8X6RW50_TRICX|nr:hypothetical protein TNCV_1467281 [Trichonephila clavipes]
MQLLKKHSPGQTKTHPSDYIWESNMYEKNVEFTKFSVGTMQLLKKHSPDQTKTHPSDYIWESNMYEKNVEFTKFSVGTMQLLKKHSPGQTKTHHRITYGNPICMRRMLNLQSFQSAQCSYLKALARPNKNSPSDYIWESNMYEKNVEFTKFSVGTMQLLKKHSPGQTKTHPSDYIWESNMYEKNVEFTKFSVGTMQLLNKHSPGQTKTQPSDYIWESNMYERMLNLQSFQSAQCSYLKALARPNKNSTIGLHMGIQYV